MPSKIKEFDFNKCQHLRKLLIDKQVEFKGNIDLTDTPLKTKNDIDQIADKQFKNIPDGVSILATDKNRVKLATTTATVGTQTDPVEIASLATLTLNDRDKGTLQLLKDSLFWYDELKKKGKDYLIQKQLEIKSKISASGLDAPEPNVRLLAEHILLITEKILENTDKFGEIEEVNTDNLKEPPQGWDDWYKTITISDATQSYYEIGKDKLSFSLTLPKSALQDQKWSLVRFRTLTTLNYNGLNLPSLPDLPSSLTTLNCPGNQLTSLPELPKGLTTLNCPGNQLTSLPELPKGLTTLNCSSNLFREATLTPPSSISFLFTPNVDKLQLNINIAKTNLRGKSLSVSSDFKGAIYNCSAGGDDFKIWNSADGWHRWKWYTENKDYKGRIFAGEITKT